MDFSYELKEHSEKDLELFLKDENGEMKSVSRGFAFRYFNGFAPIYKALAMMRFDAEKRLRFDVFYQSCESNDRPMTAAIYGAFELIYKNEALFYKTEKGWFAINSKADKKEDYFLGSQQIAYLLFGEIRDDGTASIAYHDVYRDCYEICEYKKLVYDYDLELNPTEIEVMAAKRKDGYYDLFKHGEPLVDDYFKMKLDDWVLIFQRLNGSSYQIVFGGSDDLQEKIDFAEQIVVNYVGDNHTDGAEGEVIYFNAEGKKRKLSGRIYYIHNSALIVNDQIINPTM